MAACSAEERSFDASLLRPRASNSRTENFSLIMSPPGLGRLAPPASGTVGGPCAKPLLRKPGPSSGSLPSSRAKSAGKKPPQLALLSERCDVHGPGHDGMDHDAAEDRARAERHRAEDDAGDDGAQALREGFAQVDHGVRHGHHEHGERAEMAGQREAQ